MNVYFDKTKPTLVEDSHPNMYIYFFPIPIIK